MNPTIDPCTLLQKVHFLHCLTRMLDANAQSETLPDTNGRRTQALLAAGYAEGVLEYLPLLFRPQDGGNFQRCGQTVMALKEIEATCYRLLKSRSDDPNNFDKFHDNGTRYFF